MKKNVLILCTGNSCRSIISEALINKHFKDSIKAYSAGVNPNSNVNPNAKKVLKLHNCWSDEYHSKNIEEVLNIKFDLVVTVCNNAKENCPSLYFDCEIIHIGFDDPDGKNFEEFEKTYQNIKTRLLPKIFNKLS